MATLRTEVAALQALRGQDAVVQLWEVWTEGLTPEQALQLGLSEALRVMSSGSASSSASSGSASSSMLSGQPQAHPSLSRRPGAQPRAGARARVLLVQEMLPGGELLDHLLRRKEPFSEGETRAVLRRLALAVQAAHSAGVVHRDIKPENLILRRPDDATSLVLVDFGLAKVMTPVAPLTSASPPLLSSGCDSEADLSGSRSRWQLMRTPCG